MKISNINGKVLSTSLILVLTFTSLTGCHSYKENEDGEVYLDGNISYEALSEYKLIELKTLNGNKLYIADCSGDCIYKDVFTGLVIMDLKDKNTSNELIHEYKLGDYLVALDELKQNYSSDDIKSVLNHINEVYEFESDKTLEK